VLIAFNFTLLINMCAEVITVRCDTSAISGRFFTIFYNIIVWPQKRTVRTGKTVSTVRRNCEDMDAFKKLWEREIEIYIRMLRC
jgi:hypothetical protein